MFQSSMIITALQYSTLCFTLFSWCLFFVSAQDLTGSLRNAPQRSDVMGSMNCASLSEQMCLCRMYRCSALSLGILKSFCSMYLCHSVWVLWKQDNRRDTWGLIRCAEPVPVHSALRPAVYRQTGSWPTTNLRSFSLMCCHTSDICSVKLVLHSDHKNFCFDF